MTTNRTDGLDAAGVDALLAKAQSFVDRKYVTHADARQRSMGLAYVEAERQDLAKEFANFASAVIRSALVDAPAGETVPQLGGAPDDLHNLIKVVFAEMTIEQMGEVCREVIARRMALSTSPKPSDPSSPEGAGQ